MKRQSGYRSEQLRTLSGGFARRVAVGLIAWTVLFAGWLAAVDIFIAPRAADAISSACPWRSVSAEEAGLEDTVWFEGSLERTRITMISCYAAMLTEDRTLYGEASADARGVADALVAGQGEAAGADGAVEPDAAADASGNSADGEIALQDSTAAADGAGSDGMGLNSGATHEFRSSSSSDDAIVTEALESLDESAENALFEEACSALETSPSAVRVESPWSQEQSRQMWNEIYYADGHMEYRDLRVYDFVRSLRLPAAMLVYLAGASVVVGLALSWLTRASEAFSTLWRRYSRSEATDRSFLASLRPRRVRLPICGVRATMPSKRLSRPSSAKTNWWPILLTISARRSRRSSAILPCLPKPPICRRPSVPVMRRSRSTDRIVLRR